MLLFILDEKYEYIKDEFSKDNNNEIALVKFYLNASNSYVKFKKSKGNFLIEIDNNLYCTR